MSATTPMPTTVSELKPKSATRSDRERFGEVLAVQRAAYLRDGAPSLTKRRGDLKKFKAAMLARRSAIEEAINTDFGHRSRHETAVMEIVGVIQSIDYLERNLRRFMRPTRRHTALDMRLGSNRVEYQPLGVVGIISPWNYPINLSLVPVVTAIAAGNRVMLKPSKLTPATNAVLASMLSELFSEEQVAMVNGDGSAFSSLPFDHLVGVDTLQFSEQSEAKGEHVANQKVALVADASSGIGEATARALTRDGYRRQFRLDGAR